MGGERRGMEEGGGKEGRREKGTQEARWRERYCKEGNGSDQEVYKIQINLKIIIKKK